MSKLSSYFAALPALCTGWVLACGGHPAPAADPGDAGSGAAAGTATAGTSSAAGTDSSGQAGGAQAGGTQAGGSSQGGSVGQSGSSQGGSATSGGAGAGAAGSSTAAGAAGAGGALNSGDCDTDRACGANGKCVALSVGGFRTCVLPVPPPTTCTQTDACCASDPDRQCPTPSTCVTGPLEPSCGVVRPSDNVCAPSACTLSSDCAGSNAICVPAGALDRKVSTCLTGGCLRDADCTDSPGGKCEPVTNHCCNGVTGLYCVYPGTGCRSTADCAAGAFCQVTDEKAGVCTTGIQLCAH